MRGAHCPDEMSQLGVLELTMRGMECQYSEKSRIPVVVETSQRWAVMLVILAPGRSSSRSAHRMGSLASHVK